MSALATMQSRACARSMREATEQLVRVYADEFSSGEILAAVARAKIHARAHFSQTGLIPPTTEYVALIESTARRELLARAAER